MMPTLARDPHPLLGKRVLITRPGDLGVTFADLLQARGAETVIIPTIRVTGPPDWEEVDRFIEQLDEYDWLIFTSAHGVEYFCARLNEVRLDAPIKSKIGTVGATTEAKLNSFGFRAKLVPGRFSAEGLLEAFSADLTGTRFLLPRGKGAGKELPEGLRSRGGIVDEVTVYRTLRIERPGEPGGELLRSANVDLVTFTSSSSVNGLVRMLGGDEAEKWKRRVRVASIGPKTSQTIRRLGWPVDIESPVSTALGLAEAITGFFRTAGG